MSNSEKYSALMKPYHIGNVEIKNRFVMGPMNMGWQTDADGVFTNEAIAYWAERAKGGFGAIVTGAQLVEEVVEPMLAQMSGKRVPLVNPVMFVAQG